MTAALAAVLALGMLIATSKSRRREALTDETARWSRVSRSLSKS